MQELLRYLVVLSRTSGIFLLIPGLGAQILPLRFKFAFAALLAFIFFQNLKFEVSDFYYLLLTELIIGLFLGFLARVCFEALSFLASTISMQSGLAHAQFFTLGSSEQGSALYTFLFLYATVGLFDSDTSHTFIRAIFSSYDRLPIGECASYGDFTKLSSFALNQSFLIAFKLSAPFLVLHSLLLVVSALLSRLAPSFQVFLLLSPSQNLLIFFMFVLNLDRIAVLILGDLNRALAL